MGIEYPNQIIGVTACFIGLRRGPFTAEYAERELKKLGIDARFCPIGTFPDPRLWITPAEYNQAQVVLSMSPYADHVVNSIFGENGHRRSVLDILDVYERDGKLSKFFLMLMQGYELLRHGKAGLDRLMTRQEISEELDLGQVLELRKWKELVLK